MDTDTTVVSTAPITAVEADGPRLNHRVDAGMGGEPVPGWLAQHRRSLVDDLDTVLDVEAGLAAVLRE